MEVYHDSCLLLQYSRRVAGSVFDLTTMVATIYCRLQNTSDLRQGMTGYARIYTGRRSIGEIAADRALSFLRTEFWFWW